MNVMFLVKGRWFKTLCKTVLEADTFDVSISTEKHNIHACISDKFYFLSIDNYSFENDGTLKIDFYFKRDFKNIKEFITKLDDVLSTFIVTSITDKHFCGNIDECITKILDNIKETKRETAENNTSYKMSDIQFEAFKCQLKCLEPCDFPPAIVLHQATENMTDKQKKEYSLFLLHKGLAIYHNGEIVTAKGGLHLCTTTVHAKSLLNSAYGITAEREAETATETEPETFEPFIASGEKCFHISPEISNKYDETKELLSVEQFERLTGTLCKSLFKAIGLEETQRIPIIISNNMVFFNYNGKQYKYNPSQCKVYKKDGRKYQRINWKDFTDDNSPSDQKQARGRSPPLLLI